MALLDTVRRWFGRSSVTKATGIVALAATTSINKGLQDAPVRTIIDWSPAAIKIAQLQADSGNIRQAALLCEAILGDDRAAGVLATRANALLGSKITFDPSGDGRRKNKAVKALEADEDWWALFPEEELSKLLVWGRLLGVGFGEFVNPPEIVAEGRYVPTLKVWHPSAFRWDWQSRQWFVRTEDGTELPIKAGDGKWIIYTPYGATRPWASGLWRGMGLLYLAKLYAQQDFSLHQEVHGQPLRVGFSTQPGVSPQLRKQLAADLRDLGRDTAIAIGDGLDIKLVEAEAKTWEMFTAQIDLANRSMSIQAIGSNLPTDISQSPQTGATAQNLVRIDYKRADGETLTTTLRQQGLRWWATWNFGNAELAPWPKYEVEPPEDKSATATTWKTVGDACVAFLAAGWVIDPAVIEEKFGIPLKAAPKPEPVEPTTTTPGTKDDAPADDKPKPDA